jgi:regulator of protease activity HflC (stomatin/prohibitin superfamily)
MFSNIFHTVSIKKYDTRLQTLDISGQEILTKDKISIRLNLSVNFNITDIELFHSKYSQGYDFIYQKTQFIIRELAS